jgi:hypothetical protein
LALTVAFKMASPSFSRKVAAPVTAVGALDVVKLVIGELPPPALLAACTRTKYVVPGLRPVALDATAWGVVAADRGD